MKIAKRLPEHVLTRVCAGNFPNSGRQRGEYPVELLPSYILVNRKYTLDLIIPIIIWTFSVFQELFQTESDTDMHLGIRWWSG